MLKVVLKKNMLLKKVNDDYTGRLLLKKKIQKFLKIILKEKKRKLLWVNYKSKNSFIKLFNIMRFGTHKKHFFFNTLWVKIIYLNFFKKKKNIENLKKKKKIIFFDKKKKIYILQKRWKKKLWYRPLLYTNYLKTPEKTFDVCFNEYLKEQRVKTIWFYRKYHTNFWRSFYKNFFCIYSCFLKPLLFKYIIGIRNIKIFYLKKYFYKNFVKFKKPGYIYMKKYFNLITRNILYNYKKSLFKIFWRSNLKRFFRNMHFVKNYWAHLNFKRIEYIKPIKRINFFDKKIYFLKNFFVFWGLFNFVHKKPFNKLSLIKKFAKFKNFCNVYRMNFYNILMLRIGSILLNSNFISNSYYSKYAIRKGFLLLNKKLIFTLDIICKKWDSITINNLYKFYLFKIIINRFKYIVIPRTFQLRSGFWISKYNKDIFKWNKRIFHNAPRYLYIDYRLLLIVILKITPINFNNKPVLALSFNNKRNFKSLSSNLWFKL